jgi:hypothetical protein
MASRYKGRVNGFGVNIIHPKFLNTCNRSCSHRGNISKLRIKVRMELRIRKEKNLSRLLGQGFADKLRMQIHQKRNAIHPEPKPIHRERTARTQSAEKSAD